MVFGSLMMRRVLALILALTVVGCASTPRRAETPNPHYKVGAPYEIAGKRYVPREEPGYQAVGVASWYGDAFDGKKTANGEVFDKKRLSAAHTTLPLPSLVEVENLDNGRKAIVRVNDRGPFARDRLIDLSHAAAIELGFERAGLAKVRVKYLGPADLHARAPAPGDGASAVYARLETPKAVASTDASPPPPAAIAPAPAAMVEIDGIADAISAAAGDVLAPSDGGLWITVAEFADLSDVKSSKAVGLSPGEEARVVSRQSGAKTVFSYEIGPYRTMTEADTRLALLRDAGYPDAWISPESISDGDVSN